MHIALPEHSGLVLYNLCTFLYGTHQAAVAITHGLQQAERHPLQIRWQHVYISVGIQFLAHLPLLEPSKDYVLSHSLQAIYIGICVRRSTSDDKLLPFQPFWSPILDIQVCLYEVMNPLLWDEPAQKEQIVVLPQPPLFRNLLCLYGFWPFHPIGYEHCPPAIGLPEVILDVPAQHDNLIRMSHGTPLAS